MGQLRKPSAFQQGAYWAAVVIGGIAGWKFGYGYGEMVLGVVMGIVGALIASALVAAAASYFTARK